MSTSLGASDVLLQTVCVMPEVFWTSELQCVQGFDSAASYGAEVLQANEGLEDQRERRRPSAAQVN